MRPIPGPPAAGVGDDVCIGESEEFDDDPPLPAFVAARGLDERRVGPLPLLLLGFNTGDTGIGLEDRRVCRGEDLPLPVSIACLTGLGERLSASKLRPRRPLPEAATAALMLERRGWPDPPALTRLGLAAE